MAYKPLLIINLVVLYRMVLPQNIMLRVKNSKWEGLPNTLRFLYIWHHILYTFIHLCTILWAWQDNGLRQGFESAVVCICSFVRSCAFNEISNTHFLGSRGIESKCKIYNFFLDTLRE